ncbi:MAG: division/cell wall cluster transcriptional repressor MraZ [Rhodocyclaceae bacterium]|nr:division/cell wall cluster transcriptional repressor MraZ [Rhodocyclaceae bacterium]MBR4736995.1 division/cell wall cluster transcriptional repressor MraZ [Rhodocyclaceae bacterium]MBR4876091.1 division/cell wall cluster transcriptional repressor MraZ [Rhodocyclaceae bacterium]
MFQGAMPLSLDAKGRIAIPARYRDALAPEGAPIVLTAHPDRCLMVYPAEVWAPIRERLAAIPGLDAARSKLRRLLMGMATEETPDASGRVLLAPAQRQWANLEKQVWLVGQGSHFELWSDAGWQRQQAAMEEITPEELSAAFADVVF